MINNRNSSEEKIQAIVDYLLESIEKNPQAWEQGWYTVGGIPFNAKTQKEYKGFNALYLSILQSFKGYNDPRWLTFNQVKELGGYVKSGAKSSPIFFYCPYDNKEKKEFDEKSLENLPAEERKEYIDKNVSYIKKFYQVFNAEQCTGLPEYVKSKMTEEDHAKQNEKIEEIIANSAAPINYDGGNNAYYNSSKDSIHIPKIKDFKTMQDYYATALHEIAHSTGHSSRLDRDLSGGFGSEKYAVEELRAELASVFMQMEFGFTLEGKHIQNHSAYLSSWLKAIKEDKNIFFAAVKDAEKITNYVAENYVNKEQVGQAEQVVLNANNSFAQQVDDVLNGKDTTSTHLKIMETPFLLRQIGMPNLPILTKAITIKKANAKLGTYPGYHCHDLDRAIIKKWPELLADPVMIMDSLTRDDSVVVLTATTDKENRPVIGAIKFNDTGQLNGQFVNANILSSSYGRKNFEEFIKRNIDENTILYWNNEKSQALSVNLGVQFPNIMTKLASNTIIRKAKAYVNSSEENNFENTKKDEKQVEQAQQVEQVKNIVNPYYKNYLEVQNTNPNAIYFKRLGDFYEVLGDNAKIAAEALDLTLTGRDLGLGERVPMCGVPYHAIDKYIEKMIENFDVMIDRENGVEFLSSKNKLVEQVGQAKQVDNKYYYIWSTTSTEKNNPSYHVDFYYQGIDGSVSRNHKFYGDIELDKIKEEIAQKDGNYQEIDNEGASHFDDIIYKQEYEKIKEERAANLLKAQAERKEVAMSDFYEMVRELQQDYQYNGLGEEEYEYRKAILDTYIVIEDDKYLEQAEQVEQAEKIQQNKDKINLKTQEKIEQVQQVGQVEQVGQWRKIAIKQSQIQEERGKATKIALPEGEYSSFCVFCPTKLLSEDKKTGEVKLSVNTTNKYNLMKGSLQVELTGEELCLALEGKEIGKKAQRRLSDENAQTLSNISNNIPEDMRNLPNWCVYTTKWNEQKGKKDKTIYSPSLGITADGKMQWASIDKPETWSTFDEAMQFAKENNCAGLVFALNGSGISCIDLDKSIVKNGKINDKPTNLPEGTMSSIAEKLTTEMQNTYIEKSTSGNGLHIFVKDDILEGEKYKNRVELPEGEIEVYDNKRFISMTGDISSKTISLGKSPIATTKWLQQQLGTKIVANLNNFKPQKKYQNNSIDRSDSAVIERIRKSRKGKEFDELYRGGNVTGDNSRNDMKMCNILAFFTDCDADQIERIFKQSGLYRPEKNDAYLKRTIDKAIGTLALRPTGNFGSKASGKKNNNAK